MPPGLASAALRLARRSDGEERANYSVAVDAAEAAPRQFGDAAADHLGIEVEAVGHPVPAGALGQPHQPVGQRAAVLLVDVGLDQGRDGLSDAGLHLPDRVGELVVTTGPAAEQQLERALVLG